MYYNDPIHNFSTFIVSSLSLRSDIIYDRIQLVCNDFRDDFVGQITQRDWFECAWGISSLFFWNECKEDGVEGL